MPNNDSAALSPPPSSPAPPGCTREYLADAVDTCDAARLACSSIGSGNFGSYVVHWHCTFHGSVMGVVPLGVWLAAFMLALASTADVFLIPQLNYISNLLQLKPDVAGVTLLAFGNGAADVFTGVAVATAHPEELDFSLMLSYQVGATMFITTVVVGVVRIERGARVGLIVHLGSK